MASSVLARPLESAFLFRALRGFYRRRLTERGRFLLWAALTVGFVGIDTRRALGFMLFALAAPPLLVGLATLFRSRPPLRLAGRLPARLTAGRSVTVPLEIRPSDDRATGPLSFFWEAPVPAAQGLDVSPREATLEADGGRPERLPLTLQPHRRGRYELPALGVARTDAFGLYRTRAAWHPGETVLVYPPYFTLDEELLPTGRRFQPGGIPLASEVGESLEFVGTRDYREGDALRKIHWRSWARLGRPVVKEYQEEYFARIALVLDTFLPKRPRPRQRDRFEAAITVLASLADHFSRSEEVVDILAAGPDLYEVSAGRSLGYLEGVLDVLACLEASAAAPFETVAPALHERLEGLTSVVAVMLDWDDAREAFVRRVHSMGAAVRVILVHEGATRKAWSDVPPELAAVSLLTPAQVRERLAAEVVA